MFSQVDNWTGLNKNGIIGNQRIIAIYSELNKVKLKQTTEKRYDTLHFVTLHNDYSIGYVAATYSKRILFAIILGAVNFKFCNY